MGLLGAWLPAVHQLTMNVLEQGGLEWPLLNSFSEYRPRRVAEGSYFSLLEIIKSQFRGWEKRGFSFGLQRELKSTFNFQFLLG